MPRTRQEIAEQTGINIDHMKASIQPLVDSGKLKMTMPAVPTSTRQKFVITESSVEIFSEEALIEFCREPKTRLEIMEHFGYDGIAGMKILLGRLIKNGKLKYLNPEMPMCRWQKYIKA